MDGGVRLTTRATAVVEGGELPLSDSQLQSLRVIAISAACLSLASGLLVGYWFVRMKRSFRHQWVPLAPLHRYREMWTC
jgi:G protein-coupled receptor GPR1